MGESRFLSPAAVALAPLSAPRLFILGGLALIIAGMLFGDIFAVFVLHQNGGRTGAMLLAAAQAAADQDAAGVRNAFGSMVGLLEDRGTKIDTHVHVTDAGYLSLLLALIQPYVAFSAYRKRQLAQSFLAGSIMLAVGIFLIHYVGVAHSPFAVIGWGSVLADAGGALLVLAVAAEMWGLWNHFRANPLELKPEFPGAISWAERALLSGGTLLVLLGFLYGAWYAAFDLYPQERVELRILNDLAIEASSHNPAGIAHAVDDYSGLSAARAVSIAAHSHVIEFGLLALLLSFVQPYIFLSEVWKTRWAVLFLTGSVLL
ncbi:MAG: hypothetical protein JO249_06735, partial [Acidobacteria bacterium]|nr:hypothetical protein [Acidobacteriota bacterium]